MSEQLTLNLIHQAQCIGTVDLLLDSLSYNKCSISLLSPLEGCKNKYENLDLFCALSDLRVDLEKNNWFLACYGSLDSVYPSGMSADMTHGAVAYDYSANGEGKSKKQVYIFDSVSEDKYNLLVTVDQQKKTREEYFRLKKEKWLRENEKNN